MDFFIKSDFSALASKIRNSQNVRQANKQFLGNLGNICAAFEAERLLPHLARAPLCRDQPPSKSTSLSFGICYT